MITRLEQKNNIFYKLSTSPYLIINEEQKILLKDFFKLDSYIVSNKIINFGQLLYLFLFSDIYQKISNDNLNRFKSYFEELCFFLRFYKVLIVDINISLEIAKNDKSNDDKSIAIKIKQLHDVLLILDTIKKDLSVI